MKSTGVVKRMDKEGRIVLPKPLRKILELRIDDPIEILLDEQNIVLRKYSPTPACIITGEISEENITFKKDNIALSPKGLKLILEELKEMEIEI
ncbi:AbrB/MazE/SpoVT family DNA-binding domain-containing protein [Priestia megaterium]|uniref:AbrB/MazE/SpoVT family DNA-binding domain-containing protein n=1 Tax=Priestia megaterium TaxID=1404 RepID=UPI002E249534|nr:AbrB/MazE/SpoVT family DNA-binding domain-containing protein [Priestia megaterium]